MSTMSEFWKKFFYVFTFVTQGTFFLSRCIHVVMHRMYHVKGDTAKDSHSPPTFVNVMGMMWSTQVRLQKLRRHGRPFDEYAKVRFGDDGGLFQNNHHKYQSRASFTLRRHEVAPTSPVIRLLQNLGIIRLSREIAWFSTPQKAQQSAFPEDNRRRTHPPKKHLTLDILHRILKRANHS
jgi:fatty-acid desaturase